MGVRLDVVYLDFAKAFDAVPHQELLYKLRLLGVSGNLLVMVSKLLIQSLSMCRFGSVPAPIYFLWVLEFPGERLSSSLAAIISIGLKNLRSTLISIPFLVVSHSFSPKYYQTFLSPITQTVESVATIKRKLTVYLFDHFESVFNPDDFIFSVHAITPHNPTFT